MRKFFPATFIAEAFLQRACLLAAVLSFTMISHANVVNLYQQSDNDDANAALNYFRAYAALHQAKNLPPELPSLLEKYETAPLDQQVSALVIAGEDALREMHHGVALRRCEWKVSVQDGMAADTSHRGVARELVALAGLRARLRFSGGRTADAIDDVLAAITLARHLSIDGSLTSALIAYTIEQGPVNILARHLPQLSFSEIERVISRYNSLPPSARMSDVLLSHERISRGMIEGLLEGANERQDVIKRLTNLYAFREGGAAEFLDKCGGTVAGIKERVEQLTPQYVKWAGWFSLPPEEFEKRYKSDALQFEKSNLAFKFLTPAINKARWAEAYHQTRRALLRAALDVQQSGRKALAQHLDPYDWKPFEYVEANKGFVLRSQLKNGSDLLIIKVGAVE
jgi:hypothetical protein